jgi:hypothetical protein
MPGGHHRRIQEHAVVDVHRAGRRDTDTENAGPVDGGTRDERLDRVSHLVDDRARVSRGRCAGARVVPNRAGQVDEHVGHRCGIDVHPDRETAVRVQLDDRRRLAGAAHARAVLVDETGVEKAPADLRHRHPAQGGQGGEFGPGDPLGAPADGVENDRLVVLTDGGKVCSRAIQGCSPRAVASGSLAVPCPDSNATSRRE